jgi:uncharacterized membrane protein
MDVAAFIDRYFIEPVMSSQGYNIYNTIVYGAFFVAGIYLAFKLLKQLKVKFDEKLFWSLVPFVALGGIVRALGQQTYVKGDGLLPSSFWLFTPGIYILITTLALVSLLVSVHIRGMEYPGLMWRLGALPSTLGLMYILTQATNTDAFIKIILASALVGTTLYITLKLSTPQLLTKANVLIIGGFVLDSTTTSMATAYFGYRPEHVLTGMISSSNPFLFLVFKITLIVGALLFIEKEAVGDELWLYRLVLLVLGLPHGVHDSLQILMGV